MACTAPYPAPHPVTQASVKRNRNDGETPRRNTETSTLRRNKELRRNTETSTPPSTPGADTTRSMADDTGNRISIRKPPVGWLFLLFIPFTGFISLLYMGREAGRRSWRRTGLAFGLIGYAGLIFNWFYHAYINSNAAFWLLLALLFYLVRVILGLVWWNGFKKIYAFDHAFSPDFLPGDRKWQRRNSLWLLWALVPFAQSFLFLHIGYRTENRKWIRMGWLCSLVTTFFSHIVFTNEYLIHRLIDDPLYAWFKSLKLRPRMYVFDTGFIMCIFILAASLFLFLGFYYRKEYLRSIWPADAAARNRYAILESRGWRHVNSLWMLLSLIPFGSGSSLLFAGIRTRSRRWILFGICMLLVPLLYTVSVRLANSLLSSGAHSFWSARIGYEGDFSSRSIYQLLYLFWSVDRSLSSVLIPLLCFGLSCAIREQFLRKTAANYGGFRTQIDRELAGREIQRYRQIRQKASVQNHPDAMHFQRLSQTDTRQMRTLNQQSTPDMQVLNQPVPSHQGPININTCSLEELMSLPGISVPLAMKAMAYRSENGGFESVDAFVDYLQLKPHFAVQIFERAAAAASETAGTVTAATAVTTAAAATASAAATAAGAATASAAAMAATAVTAPSFERSPYRTSSSEKDYPNPRRHLDF